MRKNIDGKRASYIARRLAYPWLDATYIKVRRGGRIVSVAAIVAVAANTEGEREVLGLAIGPSEAEICDHADAILTAVGHNLCLFLKWLRTNLCRNLEPFLVTFFPLPLEI